MSGHWIFLLCVCLFVLQYFWQTKFVSPNRLWSNISLENRCYHNNSSASTALSVGQTREPGKKLFCLLRDKKKREKRKSGVVLKTDTESAGYFNWGLLLLSLVFLDCVISLWQDWAQSDRTVLVIWHKDQACLTKWCHHDVWFGLI